MFWKKKPEPQKRKTPKLYSKNFQAASLSRLTGDWSTADRHPDELVTNNLKVLRARSREQALNNDYMARFVSLLASNVVGPNGATFQATSKDSNGNPDTLDNDAIEAAFNEWCMFGNCDITGRLSFVDIQRLFITTVGIDGEFIAIEHVTEEGYKLELMDPVLLDVDHHAELGGGRFIRFSIEFDSAKRPIAYYFTNTENAGNYSYGGKKYTRVPADRVIHAFIQQRVDQKRGFPMASTAMFRMKMLSAYEDAAITAARTGASKMGFFTSPGGDGYVGDERDDDGNIMMDMEAGVFEQLPDGMGFQAFDPNYPHQQFADFVKTCVRGFSSGLNISYNTLSNDLEGVNFSSIRTGVLEDRESWKALQEWMINCFNRRVYKSWLRVAIGTGSIVNGAGVKLPPSKYQKFVSHTWQARRWSWVDPLKDIQANVIAIENGLRSRADVIREQGRDPDEVWRELEAEKARMDSILVADQAESEVVEDDDE